MRQPGKYGLGVEEQPQLSKSPTLSAAPTSSAQPQRPVSLVIPQVVEQRRKDQGEERKDSDGGRIAVDE